METYLRWGPLKDLPEFFECYANDGDNGLELMLYTADADGRVLSLLFQGAVPAYRQIVEECRLGKFARMDGGAGQLWKVEDSEWLGQFGEADRIHYPNLTHFLIETGNQCFDVLSDTDPVAKWVNDFQSGVESDP